MLTPTKVRALALTLMVAGCLGSPLIVFAQVRQFREMEPEKGDKLDFLFKASSLYLLGGTVFDVSTTVHILDHPTMACRADGTALARYEGIETGWAGIFGRRNTAAVAAANVVLSVGLNLLSRRMYRRGGRWRVLAVGVNALKGTDNLMAGIHNVRSSAGVNGLVSASTGYTGPVIWSR